MVETITIQNALNKLKILDKRILSFDEKLIDVIDFRDEVKGFGSKSDFVKHAKQSYESIRDLIKYRDRIKAEIVKSNATTTIDVGGVKMLVADAIERKKSIEYLEHLQTHMSNQLNKVEQHYDKLKSQTDEKFIDVMKYELIDPVNLREKLKTLTDEIDNFKTNVDTALTTSNVLTVINV